MINYLYPHIEPLFRTELPEEGMAQEKTPERRPPVEVPETRALPPSPGVTLPIITSPLPRRQQVCSAFLDS